MKQKVFIDGKAGTAGLELENLLKKRDDIEIIPIREDLRKDPGERLRMIEEADISFMCLPDAAVLEIDDDLPKDSKIIDTSTAHRVSDDWVYGLAEIGNRERIREAIHVSNPGCHASGFILGVRPLIAKGLVSPDYPFAATSLTGYSGGGKQMIAEYESETRSDALASPGQYALTQKHKHLPEMIKHTGISRTPAFLPIVADYKRGMATSVPIAGGPSRSEILSALEDFYKGEKLISVEEASEGSIYGNMMAGSDSVRIFVHGSCEVTAITTVFDNLGKGAAGAAVQNMNIMLGIKETKGLV